VPVVLDLCRLWSALLTDALCNVDKATLLAFNNPALAVLRHRPLKTPVRSLVDRKPRRDAESTGGDAISATRAALAAFSGTATGSEALLQVATTSQASPAAAALCGALSGAHYGIESIPAEWRRQLAEEAPLRSLARHLLG
jgi:ADP-ribosyl-[dinitrogen reductase] hydrolase